MRKITRWINDTFSESRRDCDYNKVAEFLLLWSLFEAKIFETDFKINKAAEYIENNSDGFCHSSCHKIFRYFKERYTTPGTGANQLFKDLRFRRNDKEEFVESTLTADQPSIKDQVLASIIIIFRYRNNLFHGIKDITQIDSQKTNFNNANKLLKIFIEIKLSRQ